MNRWLVINEKLEDCILVWADSAEEALVDSKGKPRGILAVPLRTIYETFKDCPEV